MGSPPTVPPPRLLSTTQRADKTSRGLVPCFFCLTSAEAMMSDMRGGPAKPSLEAPLISHPSADRVARQRGWSRRRPAIGPRASKKMEGGYRLRLHRIGGWVGGAVMS